MYIIQYRILKYFFLGLKQLFCKIRHFKDEKESGLSFFFAKSSGTVTWDRVKKITNREIKIHVTPNGSVNLST